MDTEGDASGTGSTCRAASTPRTLYAYNLTTRTWTTRANLPVLRLWRLRDHRRQAVRLHRLHRSERRDPARAAPSIRPGHNTWSTLSVSLQPTPAGSGFSGGQTLRGGRDRRSRHRDCPAGCLQSGYKYLDFEGEHAHCPSGRGGCGRRRQVPRDRRVVQREHAKDDRSLHGHRLLVPRAPVPTARWGFGVGLVDGLTYAVGGRDGNTAAAANERYTP